MGEAKEDNSEAKEVLRTSEEKEAEKVEGNAIEIETTETIKSRRATGNEKEVNSEEQDIGRVIELDQVCSQIVLETADDSTDESDEEEEEDFVRGEENPGKDGEEADIGED